MGLYSMTLYIRIYKYHNADEETSEVALEGHFTTLISMGCSLNYIFDRYLSG